MASGKGTPKPPKVTDVKVPGESAPSASARPIIVTNRPVLKRDPMVVGGAATEATEDNPQAPSSPSGPPSLSPTKSKMVLSPLSSPAGGSDRRQKIAVVSTEESSTNIVKKAAAENSKQAESETPGSVKESSQPQDRKNSTPPEPHEAANNTGHSDEAAPSQPEPTPSTGAEVASEDEDVEDGQVAPNKVMDEALKKEQEEKAARLAEQEKVIESKKYFLPINAAQHRRGTNMAILLLVLVLVLALVWLDIVLDAGILKLGNFQPLTHFFSS
jgi:hypothetical protein